MILIRVSVSRLAEEVLAIHDFSLNTKFSVCKNSLLKWSASKWHLSIYGSKYSKIIPRAHKTRRTTKKIREAAWLTMPLFLCGVKILPYDWHANKWKELNFPPVCHKCASCFPQDDFLLLTHQDLQKSLMISNTPNILSSWVNKCKATRDVLSKALISLGSTIWENKPHTLNYRMWEMRRKIFANEEVKKKCVRYKCNVRPFYLHMQ